MPSSQYSFSLRCTRSLALPGSAPLADRTSILRRGTVVDTNNNIWVGGISVSNISFEKLENSRGGYDFWVLRFDNDGDLQWQKTIGGSEADSLTCLSRSSNGDVLLGGISYSGISGEKTESSRRSADYWVVKLNMQGQIIWQKTIGGNSSAFLRTLAVTADGGMILGGESASGVSGEKTEPYRGSGFILGRQARCLWCNRMATHTWRRRR